MESTGLVHTDTISIMDDLTCQIEMNETSLVTLLKSVDHYIRTWPGGDPAEQTNAQEIQLALRTAMLEYNFLKESPDNAE